MGEATDRARDPASSAHDTRTDDGATSKASAAAARATEVRAWVLIRVCPDSSRPAPTAVTVTVTNAGR